jgi:hypothetical protein
MRVYKSKMIPKKSASGKNEDNTPDDQDHTGHLI